MRKTSGSSRHGSYSAERRFRKIIRPAFASIVTVEKRESRPLPSNPASPGKMAVSCNPVGKFPNEWLLGLRDVDFDPQESLTKLERKFRK